MSNILAGRTHQYMRSEYIQPPPSPPLLDAKKSPLALLAQTCSAIGQDNGKPQKLSKNAHVLEHCDSPSQKISKIEPKCTALPLTNTDQSLRRKSTGSTNLYSTNIQTTTSEQTGRKISAPSVTKFASSVPPGQKFPDSAEPPDRSSRTLSATPLGISGASSSPDVSEPVSSPNICRRESEMLSSQDLSPYASSGNKQEKTSPTEDYSKCDAARHRNMSKSSKDINVSQDMTDVKSCTHWNNISHCNLASHTLKCDCGPSIPKLKRPDTKLSPKFPFGSTERLCRTCQVPHTSGACNLTSSKYQERYFPFYHLDESIPCPVVGLPTTFSVPLDLLQSQFLWSAMMNRNSQATPEESNYHMCKWGTARDGNCGKVFKTREELLDHLSCHAMPATACNELHSSCTNSNYLSPYANNPALGVSMNFHGINSFSRLGNVPLSNEQFVQPGQRRCNSLYRYHPYKTNYSNASHPFIPLLTSQSPVGVYGSYSLYDQAVRDLNSFVFP